MRVKVQVISLATATDRRAAFAEDARQAGMAWEFFDACTEMAPGLSYDEAKAIVHRGRPLTDREIACYSSHYRLWQNLLEDDCDAYVVLEDDVWIDWPFLKAACENDDALTDIDFLRFYYVMPSRFIKRADSFLRHNTKIIELLDHPYGGQAYLITKACATTFVERFQVISRPLDDQMDRYWDHGVPNLSVFPFPVVERLVASTIGGARFSQRAPRASLARRVYLLRDRIAKRQAVARRRKASFP